MSVKLGIGSGRVVVATAWKIASSTPLCGGECRRRAHKSFLPCRVDA